MSVAGLVLAAGGGRRYGGPKALVPYGGRLLVERAADTLHAAGCAPVVVVLGAAADEVRATADLAGSLLVENPYWPTGMGSSLRVGLAALTSTAAQSAVVLLADMPGITALSVRRVAAGGTAGALRMAGYAGGRRGHPVLLGRQHWAEVSRLADGDVGARPYLRARADLVRVVDCAGIADDRDVDTPADRHR